MAIMILFFLFLFKSLQPKTNLEIRRENIKL
jgi:hypothetical protein